MSNRYRLIQRQQNYDYNYMLDDSIIYSNDELNFEIIEVDDDDEDVIRLRKEMEKMKGVVPVKKKKGRPPKNK